MKIVFCGAAGNYFEITDKARVKLKKLIINFLSSHIKSGIDKFIFEIKADDGFGRLATDACFEFAEQHEEAECKFYFNWINKEIYESFSHETKTYYADKVRYLASKGLNEKGNPIYVVEFNRNISWKNFSPYEKRNRFQNICISMENAMSYLLVYKNENCLKDKYFKRIIDRFDTPYERKKTINLYAASNSIYEKDDYIGVRKQKKASKYYYRIKMILPDGTAINLERGSFVNARLASDARRKHIKSLVTQDCENIDRTFEDVFSEFVAVHCQNKPALEKKYLSYYNAHIKDKLGYLNIGETEYELENLRVVLTKYKTLDKRTKDTKKRLSQKYVLGMKAMLKNFYDYAYNKKYIKIHPMYALPLNWYSGEEE